MILSHHTMQFPVKRYGECSQFHRYRCPTSFMAGHSNFAAVAVNNRPADGEPKARSAGGAIARSIDTVEPLKDVRNVGRGDAVARVRDGHHGQTIPTAQAERDFSVWRCELDGVIDQVEEDSSQPLSVAADLTRL